MYKIVLYKMVSEYLFLQNLLHKKNPHEMSGFFYYCEMRLTLQGIYPADDFDNLIGNGCLARLVIRKF